MNNNKNWIDILELQTKLSELSIKFYEYSGLRGQLAKDILIPLFFKSIRNKYQELVTTLCVHGFEKEEAETWVRRRIIEEILL